MFKLTPLSGLVGGALLSTSYFSILLGYPAYSQVLPDGTLSTSVSSPDGLNFTIDDGDRAGNNLFHSFQAFSVPDGGSALFNNPVDIQTIFSRVTGGAISDIQGLIGANGDASLFLLNPNGILFGPNSSLNIGGSFVATTADEVIFDDGTTFSASNPQDPPILTVDMPSGLQFGNTPGSITNRSISFLFGQGLRVAPDRTLALIGGNILIDQGFIASPGSRIELGSVAGNNIVDLTAAVDGWNVSYDQVQDFQDIRLVSDNQAIPTFISTSDPFDPFTPTRSGPIELEGRNIELSLANISAVNSSLESGGQISIIASNTVELNNFSSILSANSRFMSTGPSGSILIHTPSLILSDQSNIVASSQNDSIGGNITIDAAEFVRVDGSGALSQISTDAFSGGNAGSLTLQTDQLILQNGGRISTSSQTLLASSTGSSGDAGIITIEADEIEIAGQGETLNSILPSGIFSQTTESMTNGSGGSITINTNNLFVQDGGQISAAAINGSTGQAGTLNIDASTTVRVQGVDSAITAESESPLPAGDLTIQTALLHITEAGEITVKASGDGDAGDLIIDANTVLLRDGGTLNATAEGAGHAGLIDLNTNVIDIAGQQVTEAGTQVSGIFAQTTGPGNGGSIDIDTAILRVQDGGQVSVAATDGSTGRAGTLDIDASAVVRVSDSGSAITAQSQSPLPAGDLMIETPLLRVTNNGEISVSAAGIGAAGNLRVDASSILLTNGGTLSATTKGGEGNIILNAPLITLLRNGSITTNATEAADGGNITINSFILTLLRNSNITANAIQGQGGNIDISTFGLFVDSTSSITASSEFGLDGVIIITNPELDLAAGLTETGGTVENSQLTANACPAQGDLKAAKELGEFIITGRGGMTPGPGDLTGVPTILTALASPLSDIPAPILPSISVLDLPNSQDTDSTVDIPNRSSGKITEAQGWGMNALGEVVLTASPSTLVVSTDPSPWSCSS